MGSGRKWTEEEINNVIFDYRNGMSCTKIGEKYGRNRSSIQSKLKQLGEFKSTINYLTQQEIDNIIIDFNSGMGYSDIGKKYNRDGSTIIDLLKRKGLYKKSKYYFTNDEISFLIENYPNESWEYIMKRFEGKNVSKQSIILKMSSLGIKRDCYFWSKEDIEILKKYYNGDNSVSDIYKKFNGKYTYAAIQVKANKLSLKTREFWSEPEIELMIEKYESVGVDGMITMLNNRSRNSIIGMAQKLNLNFAYWKDNEIEYIKNNWNVLSDYEMSKHLNRTQRATKAKREELGLYRRDNDNKNYADISKFLRANISEWKTKSMKACDYKCIFTGEKDFQIHHLYSVSNLIKDTFDCINIRFKERFEDYTEKELLIIKNKFIELQNSYPLGVCISKPIHILFHQLYGSGNNTPEQWYIFSKNFKEGEYDSLLRKVS